MNTKNTRNSNLIAFARWMPLAGLLMVTGCASTSAGLMDHVGPRPKVINLKPSRTDRPTRGGRFGALDSTSPRIERRPAVHPPV